MVLDTGETSVRTKTWFGKFVQILDKAIPRQKLESLPVQPPPTVQSEVQLPQHRKGKFDVFICIMLGHHLIKDQNGSLCLRWTEVRRQIG